VIAAVTAIAGFGAAAVVLRPAAGTPSATTPVRFEVQLVPGTALTTPQNGLPVLAISPDGNQIVYSAGGASGSMLYRRSVSDLTPAPIPGTDFADAAAFSPNGKWLAVVVRGKLIRLAVDGSSRDVITEINANGVTGLTWVSDDDIVFGHAYLALSREGLRIVRASGGEPRVFTTPYDSSPARLPVFLVPVSANDGEHVLFTAAPTGITNFRLGLTSVRTGKSQLIEGAQGSAALGMIGDRMIYVRGDGALLAAKLDLKTATASDAVVLSESVTVLNYFAGAVLSRSGSLLMTGGGQRELVRVAVGGTATPLLPLVGSLLHPRLSPDATRLVVDDRDTKGAFLRVADLRSGTMDRTAVDDGGSRAEWTPDGRRLLYPSGATSAVSANALRVRAADGSADAEDLWQAKDVVREGVMSPDGRSLVIRVDHPTTGRDLLLVDLPTKQVTALAATSADEKLPRISPDGRWLAYTTDESGVAAVYVRRLTAGAGRTMVSAGAGTEPVWSRDGSRLFYRVGTAVVEAALTFRDVPTVTGRRQLFDGRYETDPFHASYDVFPDGRTFVMVRSVADSRRLVLVRDWAAELASRVTQQR
jgi:hypothetical protein